MVVFSVNVSIIVGQSLASQFTWAIKMRARHIALFGKFSARFTPATIETWMARITAWEADTSKPCPYEEPSNGESKLYKKKILILFVFFQEQQWPLSIRS